MGGGGTASAPASDEPYVRDTTVDDVIKDLKGE